MFQHIRHKRGQSTLEYAILILIIIAAILTIQTYVKRGIQGRLKSAADDIGDQFSTAEDANYHKWVNTISKTRQKQESGVSSTELRENERTNTLSEITLNANGEYWGAEEPPTRRDTSGRTSGRTSGDTSSSGFTGGERFATGNGEEIKG